MNPLIPILFMFSMALGISSCEKDITLEEQVQKVVPIDTTVNDLNFLFTYVWRWDSSDPKPEYVSTLPIKSPMIGEDKLWNFNAETIFFVQLYGGNEFYYKHWNVEYLAEDSMKVYHFYQSGLIEIKTYPWFVSKSDSTLYLEEQFYYVKLKIVGIRQ